MGLWSTRKNSRGSARTRSEGRGRKRGPLVDRAKTHPAEPTPTQPDPWLSRENAIQGRPSRPCSPPTQGTAPNLGLTESRSGRDRGRPPTLRSRADFERG